MPSRRRAPASAQPTAAPEGDTAQQPVAPGKPRVLKKYPNRRLYDTHNSSYITLADVKQMVLQGLDFEVRDAKTGEEITRSILLQIILEEESGGVPMFSTGTLSQIIRFYGHAMQGAMGTMLERNMAAFAELQQQFVQQSKALVPGFDAKPLSAEAWAQFMRGQPALLQNMMGSYFEQGRSLLESMQQAGGAWFPGAKK